MHHRILWQVNRMFRKNRNAPFSSHHPNPRHWTRCCAECGGIHTENQLEVSFYMFEKQCIVGRRSTCVVRKGWFPRTKLCLLHSTTKILKINWWKKTYSDNSTIRATSHRTREFLQRKNQEPRVWEIWNLKPMSHFINHGKDTSQRTLKQKNPN